MSGPKDGPVRAGAAFAVLVLLSLSAFVTVAVAETESEALRIAAASPYNENGIIGTPAYMSPEQAGGKQTTRRSDLYSLGAVLFRCAVGEQLISGKTTAAALKEIAEQPSPTSRRLGGLVEGWPLRR